MRQVPWYTMGARLFIDAYIQSKDHIRILEYGAGGSTIYYSKLSSVELTTIEHDKGWVNKVANKLGPLSSILIHLPKPYYTYTVKCSAAQFDILLVDGRDRNMCIEWSLSTVKPGGLVVLDNSERSKYNKAKGIMKAKGYTPIHFVQKVRDDCGFAYPNWTTTIWVLSS